MASVVADHHGSLVAREDRMTVLRTSLRVCEEAEEVDVAPAACGEADSGDDHFGNGFSVEDLLDLDELCEVDKDCEEVGEATPAPAVVDEEKLSSDSHVSSLLSYELMALPPPVIDLSLPVHDEEELEWVSRIMDDSLAELPPPPKLPAVPVAAASAARRSLLERFGPTPSPAHMRTATECALSTEVFVPVKARRSKRSRASVWSLSAGAPLSDSTLTSSTPTTSSSSSSSANFSSLLFLPADSPSQFGETHLLRESPPPRGSNYKKPKHGGKHGYCRSNCKHKKRGRKLKHHPSSVPHSAYAPAPVDRRCSHCGVQKTPQWRAGPEGAKTLCNACGVRYKQGRLLPEYRPACSPTFVSTIHSNSHRKVLEMRRNKESVVFITGPAPLPAVAPF